MLGEWMVNTGPLLLLTAPGRAGTTLKDSSSPRLPLSPGRYPAPRTPAPPGTSEAWQGRGIRASPGLWCCQGALPFMRLNATATQAPPRRDQSLASARCPGFPSVTFEESRRYEHHGERKAERLNRSSVCGNIPSRSPSQPIT